MNVLVTGASGFLGGRIVEALAATGRSVRGLVRDPDRWNRKPERAVVVLGDVVDLASLHRAAEDCEAVVHAAALSKTWVRDRREFDRVNVQGAGNVIEASRVAGARLLYVSSFVALGSTNGGEGDEDPPRDQTHFHSEHQRTQWVADQMMRSLTTDRGPLPVRVYPGVVYGPGELTAGNHVVGLLLRHAAGRLRGVPGTGTTRQCFSFVDDVVAGVVAALDRAEPGAGYVLGGDNRTVVDLFDAFREASGVAPPRRRTPFATAITGTMQRWLARLPGREPDPTDDVGPVYRYDWAYSSARAERDLGYRVTPLEEGVRKTVAWMRRESLL